ncbi:MAG: DUF2283 domain-containing protein [bacterium]
MEKVKVWFDQEGDYLEIVFESKAGYFKETHDDRVMEKVDQDGNVIGFSIMNVSSVGKEPLKVELIRKSA